MAQVISGFAGCGKTYELIKRINSAIENEKCSPYEILVLTTAQDKDVYLQKHKGITIWFFDELNKFILKKNPSFFEKKFIPDYIALTIIGDICKDLFKGDSALNSLTKSETFFRELYNLFCIFKTNKISPDVFKKTADETEISETDEERLNLVAEVYKKYVELLDANSFLDFRDMEICALNTLKENELAVNILKSRFKRVFIDGFENISELQLEIVNLFTTGEKLCVTFDENSQIQEFRGALDIPTLKEKVANFEKTELLTSKRNNEILQRALFLVKKYNNCEFEADFQTTEKLNYKLFNDVQNEINFIADDIEQKIKEKGANYSDFAILIRDYNLRQKFADFLLSVNIPVQNAAEDNVFKNFMLQFSRYIDIFSIFKKFNMKDFSLDNLKRVSLPSKADIENLFNELNLYFENILSEVLENIYIKDRFVSILDSQNRLSLMNVVGENLKILTESDKNKVESEFYFIRNAYNLYENQDFTEFAILLAKKNTQNFSDNLFVELLGEFTSKISAICDLYKNILNKPINPDLLKNITSQIQPRQEKTENTVNLLTFFKTGGNEYKYVYIPCLTENNFPKRNKSTYFISFDTNKKLSEAIRKSAPRFSDVIEDDTDGIKEEARLFYIGLTRATEELFISTHLYQDKKQIPISVFLQALLDKENIEIKDIKEKKKEVEKIELNFDDFSVETDKTTILKDDEEIKLSPSSIGNYQCCPQKFYFANLLNLKTSGTFAANYGTIVHAVFEVFNKTGLNDYTKEHIINLADILFNSKVDPNKAIDCGFEQLTIDLINATDDLSLEEMKEQFEEAVNCLEKNGFFLEIPDEVETEKVFNFKSEEIPNVTFTGRIDAICRKGDLYQIYDYKTGADKKCSLSYYVSENGVNFLSKTGKEPKDKEEYINGYEYQIPVYYLASQNASQLEELKNKVGSLALRYVRPKNKCDGSKDDKIQAIFIEQFKDKIIKNLKETIVDKIRETTEFKPKKSYLCDSCEFGFICGKEDDND